MSIRSLVLAAVLVACSGSPGSAQQGTKTKAIDQVLAAHNDSLLALPGVVGTAIGLCDGERCIKVMLADSNPATRAKIPARLEQYRVVVEVTGAIRPR